MFYKLAWNDSNLPYSIDATIFEAGDVLELNDNGPTREGIITKLQQKGYKFAIQRNGDSQAVVTITGRW